MKNEQKSVLNICLAGLMAAVITVCTAFLSIRTGFGEGYIHFGDSMVYLAACILGPYGFISAAIGGALADILAGAAVWAIPTAIIKILNCIPFVVAMHFYRKKKAFKIVNVYTVTMTIVSALITVAGYYIAGGLIYSFASAVAEIPLNCIQAIASGVIFTVAGAALDAAKINRIIKK